MSAGSVWVQGEPGSGEASLDYPGPVLDLLQAVPDDVDQVGEAGDGEDGQDPALEHRPDPFHRGEVRGVGGQPEHAQPGLGAGEGPQLSAPVDIEVVPGAQQSRGRRCRVAAGLAARELAVAYRWKSGRGSCQEAR